MSLINLVRLSFAYCSVYLPRISLSIWFVSSLDLVENRGFINILMAVELVEGAVLGTAFSGLYEGVKELIDKNLIYKLLCEDIKSSLDSLEPLIQQIRECNDQLLYCSKEELQGLGQVMKEGKELVDKCLKVSRTWNPFKKYKYAIKLLGLEKSLKRQVDILKVQGIRDLKKIAVAVENTAILVDRVILNQSAESSTSSSSTQHELCKVLELPPLPRLLFGLDVPLKELKSKLLENDGVSMLVVTAPGGCGKTTLATMVCQDQQVKVKFKENIVFVTVSQNGTLNLIVQRLYAHKRSQVPTLQNEVHAVQWLHTFLKEETQNPLLLVLDDVWSGSESLLEYFQIQISNCKILVTSRSEFPRFGPSYHLPLLNDGNAMELFRHSASLGDKISHVFVELSRRIVKHCNGFPLAITVVGRSLCKQPIEIWRKKVTEWSKGSSILDSETKLLLCLKSSLDALDKEMKECFLDLGSFPEDSEIRVATLIDMWAELYDLDEETLCLANVYELSNRSLANFIDRRPSKMEGEEYYDCYYVKQHDMLREFAIYHAKLDPVEQRRRVHIEICGNNLPKWWREQRHQPIKARLLSISTDEKFSMEWPNMQLPEAEVLVLHFQTQYYALPEFVQKMDKLKVLVVVNRGNSSQLDAELSNFELLGSLSNLKRIRLERIFIPSITKKPIQLKSLRKLSIFRCRFGRAFNEMSDAFPNLEELNILYTPDDVAPDLWDLIHLKRLSITYCLNLFNLPGGIENLVNLQILRLRRCIFLERFPGSIRKLKKLNFLDLTGCEFLEELPEYIGEMSSLRKLDMRQCNGLKRLPKSVIDLNQLEEVICDDYTKRLWEPFLPTLKNIRLVIIN